MTARLEIRPEQLRTARSGRSVLVEMADREEQVRLYPDDYVEFTFNDIGVSFTLYCPAPGTVLVGKVTHTRPSLLRRILRA